MIVPFVDVKAQYLSIKSAIDGAVASVFEEGQFIGGHWVNDFETAFAQYLGLAHCMGCGNGTDSLEMALKVLEIGEGDEVIVPASSWISSSACISSVGAKAVFADILPHFYTIDPIDLQKKITSKTKAIIPVHLYGLPADMPAIMRIADQYQLKVIEDCAQAVGAQIDGKMVGTFGDLASFSFYPTKNLGAYGDAGALVTNHSALADKIRILANHGQKHRDQHLIEGRNSRLDSLQAAILLAKLPFMDQWTRKRRANAGIYNDLLSGKMATPMAGNAYEHAYHIYAVQVENREYVMERLASKGVQTGIHFPEALPFLEPYQYLKHKREDFPHASKLAHTTLSLPIYPELTEEQIYYVIKCLLE